MSLSQGMTLVFSFTQSWVLRILDYFWYLYRGLRISWFLWWWLFLVASLSLSPVTLSFLFPSRLLLHHLLLLHPPLPHRLLHPFLLFSLFFPILFGLLMVYMTFSVSSLVFLSSHPILFSYCYLKSCFGGLLVDGLSLRP